MEQAYYEEPAAAFARARLRELVAEDLPEVIVRGDRSALGRMPAHLVENGITRMVSNTRPGRARGW